MQVLFLTLNLNIMNNTENNILIAEFLGFEHKPEIAKDYYLNPETKEHLFLEHIKYNSSWDWLLPVIKECSKIEKYDDELRVLMFWNLGELDLEETYKAVINFIKWHNENKTNH